MSAGWLLLLAFGCRSVDGSDSGVAMGAADSGGSEPVLADHVVINELMADNEGLVPGPEGSGGDWIELFNPTSETVDLSGYSLSDAWTDPGKHRLPDGLRLAPGDWLLLWADDDPDAGPDHVGFQLDAAGEGVGLFDPTGAAVDWVVFGPQEADQARARLPDAAESWQEMPGGTPGARNGVVAWVGQPLLKEDDSWAWWDQGSLPGLHWTATAFDDSDWPVGPAPLGYGDPVNTTVGYGPDPNYTYVTTWFRTRLQLPAEPDPLGRLAVSLRCDDGAVVYIDGVERFRLRMPQGEISAETKATATVAGTDETTYTTHWLSPEELPEGEVVLAVEVHQAGPKSTDMSMAMQVAWEELALLE